MAVVEDRLKRRIQNDFPAPGSADEIIRLVGEASESERIQAAIVFSARGDLDRLRQAIALTEMDWRDTLVAGGLEHNDWRERLDFALGPAS